MVLISRQAGETIMVGDVVEVTVNAIEPTFVNLDVRHTTPNGRVTLEDSFRRDAARDAVIDLPVTGRCTVADIRGDKVRIGVEAPKDVSVHRKEVYDLIRRRNRRDGGNL